MFQRPHRRSDRALDKQYRFAWRPLAFDVAPLLRDIQRAPLEWIESQWKWHVESQFCILRAGERHGYAGSELTRGHSVDSSNLTQLQGVLAFFAEALPFLPKVAWIGELPQGARIFLHVDNTKHWDEHHRFHVPLLTNADARLCVEGKFLHLTPGRLWLINNSVPHGAINRGERRLHLVMDVADGPEFQAWLSEATFEAGAPDDVALAELSEDPTRACSDRGVDAERMARMLLQ